MKRVFLLVLVVGTETGLAQSYDKLFSIGWDNNIPLSNTSYVKKNSSRGMRASIRQFMNEQFVMGGDFSWAAYEDYSPRQTYPTSGGALTTDFFKYVYSYGLTLSGGYYFRPGEKIRPYAGLGLGASYNDFAMYYNVYSADDKKWGVLLRPEAGVLIRFTEHGSWGALAAVHYDYASTKSTDAGYSNFSNVGIQLGIVVIDW